MCTLEGGLNVYRLYIDDVCKLARNLLGAAKDPFEENITAHPGFKPTLVYHLEHHVNLPETCSEPPGALLKRKLQATQGSHQPWFTIWNIT